MEIKNILRKKGIDCHPMKYGFKVFNPTWQMKHGPFKYSKKEWTNEYFEYLWKPMIKPMMRLFTEPTPLEYLLKDIGKVKEI